MHPAATLVSIRKDLHVGLARIPTAEGEPALLLTLAAAGDMRCRAAEQRGPEEPREDPGCRRRRELLARLGAGDRRLITLHQVHSRRVFWTDELPGLGTPGDGLLTAEAGVLPAVTVADCMPIFLFAAGSPLRGIVHSGWRGTGIAAEALRRIGERHALPPRRITAVLGPAIGPCCYRVDEGRAEEFARRWGPEAVRYHDGAPHLDLPAANAALLREAGVEDLRAVQECTVCGGGYGSFRREGPESFTHMLATIADFPVD